jgi:hypothetical protein
VFGGKQGVLYEINSNRMGGIQRKAGAGEVESFRLSTGIFGAPAYWNGHLYTFASEDRVKEFAVSNGWVAPSYSSSSAQRSEFSGGTPTVSANGNREGIVWVVETRAWNAAGSRAILRAYDASDLRKRLYSSEENPLRDQGSEAVRFAIPTVANGRVYVGGVKVITVYGLLGH